ncbi:MAG: hypothetical protein NC402_02185 [Prevotella sp.]|nr:hypothetical protein [Prevotella sp.]MCM1074608.1 hypothetical protein [Ruminococcus sp.]
MKFKRLLPLLFAAAFVAPIVTACDDDDDYGKDNNYASGKLEINDVNCESGSYSGYSGWDADRQKFIMPLTYRFNYAGNITDGYFTLRFTGSMPKVGDNLAASTRNLTLSTDGVNSLAYRSGKAIVRKIDLQNNRITIEYDDLEMGAVRPDPNASFANAGSYEIEGWQTVSFDFSTGPGVL